MFAKNAPLWREMAKKEKRGGFMATEQKTLRSAARQAKYRLKGGFWAQCEQEKAERLLSAQELGLNVNEAGRHFHREMHRRINEEAPDEFYEKVKEMLLQDGEVSDAIGRLTDQQLFASLSYEEKQRYTLALSERYLRALERFKRECAFDKLSQETPNRRK